MKREVLVDNQLTIAEVMMGTTDSEIQKLVRDTIGRLHLTDYEFFQTAWVWAFPARQYDVASDTCQWRMHGVVQSYMYDFAWFISERDYG